MSNIRFRGLFFGDCKKLTRIQKKFLESIKEKGRNGIRKVYMDREINNFHKLAERLGIAGEKLEKLEQMTILSRIPPPYEETLKIVKKNEKLSSESNQRSGL